MTINKISKILLWREKKKPAMNEEVQAYDHCQQTIKKKKNRSEKSI